MTPLTCRKPPHRLTLPTSGADPSVMQSIPRMTLLRAAPSRRRRAATVTLAAVLMSGACTNSDSAEGPKATPSANPQSPGTTLPKVANREGVVAFFAGQGQPLLKFRRATDGVLNTEPAMRVRACSRLVNETLPGIARDVTTITRLAAGVPDELTARLATNDVAARLGLLSSCVSGRPDTGERIAEVRALAAPLDARLAQVGVKQ